MSAELLLCNVCVDFLAVAIASGAVLENVLKLGFSRARPDIVAHLVEVNTSSFPSGHAMNSAITYLSLGALLARAEKDSRVRIYLLIVAIGGKRTSVDQREGHNPRSLRPLIAM